jgi:uncharacterized protein
MTQMLVYTRTTGYRHDSIEAGVEALAALGSGLAVRHTEDPTVFEDGLAGYPLVVFLSTSGDVLTDAGRRGLRAHLAAGGGFAGIHSALCTEYSWPFFGGLLGAWFADHPEPQELTVHVHDPAHPANAGLPARWRRHDEAYNLRAHPGPGVTVLASLDESGYHGGTMGADHPIAWCHEYAGGRAFVTALGHDGYDDPYLRAHLLGGIRYAAGIPAPATPVRTPHPA